MKNTADISRMSICWNRAFDTSMKKLNQMAVTELFHCQNTYIFYFFVTFRPFIKKILTLCPFSRTNTYIFSIFIKKYLHFSIWRRNDTHMPQCQDIFLAAPSNTTVYISISEKNNRRSAFRESQRKRYKCPTSKVVLPFTVLGVGSVFFPFSSRYFSLLIFP